MTKKGKTFEETVQDICDQLIATDSGFTHEAQITSAVKQEHIRRRKERATALVTKLCDLGWHAERYEADLRVKDKQEGNAPTARQSDEVRLKIDQKRAAANKKKIREREEENDPVFVLCREVWRDQKGNIQGFHPSIRRDPAAVIAMLGITPQQVADVIGDGDEPDLSDVVENDNGDMEGPGIEDEDGVFHRAGKVRQDDRVDDRSEANKATWSQ